MPAGLRIGQARGSAASLTILVPAGAGGTFFSRPSQQRGDQARPGRVVSLLCSPRAYPRMPSAKSQGPAPLAVVGTSAPQGEMRWGGGGERLFPVDDLVSFHGTNENRGVFSSPIASPTSASVRLGHGPLCRDEGPSPRSAPRAPLPRLSPGAAPSANTLRTSHAPTRSSLGFSAPSRHQPDLLFFAAKLLGKDAPSQF